MDNKPYIINYLQKRLRLTVQDVTNSLLGVDGKLYPARNIKILIDKYIKDFLGGRSNNCRWLVVPGIRGVGKTTLLRQIYLDLINKQLDINMLYITLDQLVDNLEANLYQTLRGYEEIMGFELERVAKPTFIFIDEVQADPKWARTLKTVYDNSRTVFLFCTGSAATHLQMDADIAGRRAIITKLYPLSFTEFRLLGYHQYPKKNLGQQITTALYFSKNAKEAFLKLEKLQSRVHQSWINYTRQSLKTYLTVGSLPFGLGQISHQRVRDSLATMLDKVVDTDLRTLKNFDVSSCVAIKRLLFILADTGEAISAEKLTQTLAVSRSQVFSFLDTLIKAELLIKVPAYGSHMTSTRQPARYKFMSPAIRHFYQGVTNTLNQATIKGMLLEDVVALYYYRQFINDHLGHLSYSAHPNQADFILQLKNGNRLALEFGWGKKDGQQLKSTMAKISCQYGLVFSNSELVLIDDGRLKVPLDYFFLT